MLLSELLALFRWLWVAVRAEVVEEELVRRLMNRTMVELVKQFVGKVVDDSIASDAAFSKVSSALKDYNYFRYEKGDDQIGVRNAVNLLLHRYMAYDKSKSYLSFGDPKVLQDSGISTLDALTGQLMDSDFDFQHGIESKSTSMLPFIKKFFDKTTNFNQLKDLYPKDGRIDPQESVMYLFYINVRRHMAKQDWNVSDMSSYFWPDLTNLPVVDYTHRPLVTNRQMFFKKNVEDEVIPVPNHLAEDLDQDLADRLETKQKAQVRLKPKTGGRQ